jgi:hypothetical protein
MAPLPSSYLEIPMRDVIVVGMYSWNVVPEFALVVLLNFPADVVEVPLSWIDTRQAYWCNLHMTHHTFLLH